MKRIIFICGSLAEGKDGVGDYTRRLSAELMKQGNQIKIIALNDRYISTFWEGLQNQDDTDVPVVRYSNNSPWKYRIEKIQALIKEFNPHWISLQYVPYSFNKRGMPYELAHRLKKISSNAKWHIMFHELWIGINKEASMKHRFIGLIQKNIVRKILTIINPSVIHTQTQFYQFMIKKIGFDASILPLFGNISVNNEKAPLKKSGTSINFVLFGSIQYGAPINIFIEEIASYLQEQKIEGKITFIGFNGTEINAWANECSKANVSAIILGEQPPKVISECLLTSHFGIITTPILLAEKSGSLAAMLEHGLAVICVAREWKPRYLFTFVPNKYIFEFKTGTLKTYLQQHNTIHASASVTSVAKQFINDIS